MARSFSCQDCNKVFFGNEFNTHTSCISEAEKYQGALFKGKVQDEFFFSIDFVFFFDPFFFLSLLDRNQTKSKKLQRKKAKIKLNQMVRAKKGKPMNYQMANLRTIKTYLQVLKHMTNKNRRKNQKRMTSTMASSKPNPINKTKKTQIQIPALPCILN